MLKYAFLAGAMMLAVPAFAQDVPVEQKTQPITQTAPGTTDATPAQPTQAVPAAPAPTESVPTPAAPAASAPVQDAAATPAQDVAAAKPSGNQVADAVTKDFATYDKNGDGALSAAEFDTWMVALKTQSDPATKASAPATKTWLTQAFAQADKNKNRKVSKAELTGFLSQG